MLVFFFLEKKKARNSGYRSAAGGGLQRKENSIRNSPKSHSAIKTKASARPSGAIKTFCFVLPVRKICLKINYKRKENRYLCSHFHHDGTPLVRTSNTAFCTARQS